jgi:hypothetical protein
MAMVVPSVELDVIITHIILNFQSCNTHYVVSFAIGERTPPSVPET